MWEQECGEPLCLRCLCMMCSPHTDFQSSHACVHTQRHKHTSALSLSLSVTNLLFLKKSLLSPPLFLDSFLLLVLPFLLLLLFRSTLFTRDCVNCTARLLLAHRQQNTHPSHHYTTTASSTSVNRQTVNNTAENHHKGHSE